MLDKTDIQFIIGILNKATVQGLQANHKMVEVFLKLKQLLEQEEGKEYAAKAMAKLMKQKDKDDGEEDDGADQEETVVEE